MASSYGQSPAGRPAAQRRQCSRLLLHGRLYRQRADRPGARREAVSARTGVGPQHLDAAGEQIEDVRDLEDDTLERGARDFRPGRPARHPTDQSARLRVPVRQDQCSEGRATRRRASTRRGGPPLALRGVGGTPSPSHGHWIAAPLAESRPRAHSRQKRTQFRAAPTGPARAQPQHSRARSCRSRRSPSPRRARRRCPENLTCFKSQRVTTIKCA